MHKCFQFVIMVIHMVAVCYGEPMPLAVLHVEGLKGSADACAQYNPHFSALPITIEETQKRKVYLPTPPDGCDPYYDIVSASDFSVFVGIGGNCTLFDKLRNVYHSHSQQAVVIADRKTMKDFRNFRQAEYNQINLQVGLIAQSTWVKIQELGYPLYVQLYHPHDPTFDPNLIVIWFIALFTVAVGAYWCGKTLEKSGSKVIDKSFFDLEWAMHNDKYDSISREEDIDSNHENREGNNFPITTIMVVVFVLMICTVLLLLYFFYKYLIYVVLFLFAVASITGTYECLSALLSFIECGRCRVPENNIPLLKDRPEIRNIILLAVCFGLSIYWVVIRNESYSWVLQDFLGICFCINLIKMIRLPNLKISAMLLMALLVYDIFFVFITPLFSAHGKSVMVEVATGNGSNEQLPMVIRVPKIIKSALAICERPYSILGFGDILLPGLFVAFCHNFDVIANVKYRLYFLASCIAYGLGLAATFIALIYMKIGQPALLYLAPSVLIACVSVGAARGELKALWRGRIDILSEDANRSINGNRVHQNESISEIDDIENPEKRQLLKND